MSIDLVTNFAKYEKVLTDYIWERIQYFRHGDCFRLFEKRVKILNQSWDMDPSVIGKYTFKTNMSYGLVKQQQLARRAVFSNNFRAEPLFTPKSIGNTSDENAINMRDLIQANNEQTKFRHKVLMPGNGSVAKIGVAIAFTEYCNDKTLGWRTVSDPLMGSRRVYGPIRDSKNAVTYLINPLNYFQDPKIVESDDSTYRGHLERWTMAQLVNRIRNNKDLYIRENVQEVINKFSKEGYKSELYIDQSGKTTCDIGKTTIDDVIRGQFQFHIDGNEDDSTYYYIEMIDDKIIRFQDNPYDMNMNHYTILTCERRDEYFWGNTPAEYSLQNEANLNLLLSMDLSNAIAGMKRYVLYNKAAIDSDSWKMASINGHIGVDGVPFDTPLQNILSTYQIPDIGRQAIGDAYARALENDQRFSSTPDTNRPTSMGGPTNKTATAVNQATAAGDVKDSDILERLSFCWSSVADKISIILMQFLDDFDPITVGSVQAATLRKINKMQISGEYSFAMDTALQQSYNGEIIRYQNTVTWLQNLINGGVQIPVNLYPFVEQVLKMGKFIGVDKYQQGPDQQAAMAMQNQAMSQGAIEQPIQQEMVTA